ncbi:MAG: MFS transporter [Acidobacteriota bacterium]
MRSVAQNAKRSLHLSGSPNGDPPMAYNSRKPGDTRLSGKTAGRWVLAAAILGSSVSFIDGTVVNVALPVLQTSLNATVAQTQWVVESYSLMLSALILVGGSLGDRLGRNKVFSAGVFLFGASSIWCAISPDITQLIIARGLQGIGAALLVPGSLALISANFSKEKRGRAIGTWSGISAVAAGIGPVLGGWLVQNVSWRAVFWINVPTCAAVLLISWLRIPESLDDEAAKSRFDWLGPLLATVGLGGIVLGLVESNGRGFSDALVIASLAIGVIALGSFIFAEYREKHPMMPLGLFASPVFMGANLLTLFLYAGLSALMFFLPFDLIQIQGYPPTAAGAALLPFVITMFVLSRWAGGLVDQYGSRLPLTVGPLIAAAGFALFALPGADSQSYWTSFFPAVMVMSIGMSIAVAPLTTTVMGAVEERHAGIASGINNAVSRTAGLLAIAIFGVIMMISFGRGLEQRVQQLNVSDGVRSEIVAGQREFIQLEPPPEADPEARTAIKQMVNASFVDGFRVVILLCSALGLLSAIFAWLLIPKRKLSC